MRVANFDALRVQDTVLAIACTPSDPLDCIAVGLDGLIVRGDGTSWRVQVAAGLGAGAHRHHRRRVRRPHAAAGHDRRALRRRGVRRRLRARRRSSRPHGRRGSARRGDARSRPSPAAASRSTAASRATAARRSGARPLRRWSCIPYALAAYRDADGAVRAIVSATSDPTPLPDPVEPDDDDRNPPTTMRPPQHEPVPLAPSPADAVVLRETADGWIDLDRASFQRSGGRDLPDMTPNTRAILVDGDGSGHPARRRVRRVDDARLHGRPGRADPRRRGFGAPARTRRPRARARARRPRPPRRPRRPARCASPSAAIRRAWTAAPAPADRATRPTRTCRPRSPASARWSAGGAGPAALLIGGGRASLGGEPLDPGGARRYRELTQGAGVPTYVLPGPGDLPNGGAEAFASAFASAPAPQGTGDAPAGVDLAHRHAARGARAPARRGARSRSTCRRAAGTVRVIAIDNAAGRLAGGPDGAQARWIRETMEQARRHGFPSIVVGSMPLDDTQAAKPAEDAADEIALLAGHASAYVATAGVDDPADRHFGGVLAQSVVAAPGVAALAHAAPVLDARLRAGPELHGRPRSTRGGASARRTPRC